MSKAIHTELFRQFDDETKVRVRLVKWNARSKYIPDTHTVFILEVWEKKELEYKPFISELWEGEDAVLIRRAIARFDDELGKWRDG